MTDKRTHRRIKAAESDDKSQKGQPEDNNEPTKEQYTVGKYLRWNCSTKQTPMEGRGVVVYFTASKAVDTLLDSKWATNKGGKEPLFTNRESATRYLDDLLKRDFFHRAKKITVKRIGGREEGQQFSETESSPRTSPKAKQQDKKKQEQKQLLEQQAEESGQEGGKKERRKKKIKLEWHPVQRFVDGKEAYVWLYEPTSISQIVYGSLIVLGAIGLCLFPLWPPIVRQGVYYLALTAASLIGFLFFLAAFRYVPFTIAWLVTAGKLTFWLLPNLTQDVGFLESFMPIWEYEWNKKDGTDADAKKDDSKSKRNKTSKKAASKKSDADDDDADDNDEDAEHSAKPDAETEEDDENVPTTGGNDAEDDQTTLHERSSSRQSRKSAAENGDDAAPQTDATDAKQNAADQHDTLPESLPRASNTNSSQDSASSQEEFEIIERDDKQPK